MKKNGFCSLFLLVPALIGLTLTSCGGGDDTSSSPEIFGVTPEYIDIKTPYTDNFSASKNIEAKLQEVVSKNGRNADFKKDKIAEVIAVDHFTDGDTFSVKVLYDGVETVKALRFYNVDTPETHHPEKGTEPWGMAASQYTEMIVQRAIDGGKKIIIEGGRNGIEETYDRVVAYIWVDGVLLNMALAEIGLATYGVGNKNNELYADDIFQASWYRKPANGYAWTDRILVSLGEYINYDPNWTYGNNCGNAPVETNVCVKNKDYKYDFREVGPTHDPVIE